MRCLRPWILSGCFFWNGWWKIQNVGVVRNLHRWFNDICQLPVTYIHFYLWFSCLRRLSQHACTNWVWLFSSITQIKNNKLIFLSLSADFIGQGGDWEDDPYPKTQVVSGVLCRVLFVEMLPYNITSLESSLHM